MGCTCSSQKKLKECEDDRSTSSDEKKPVTDEEDEDDCIVCEGAPYKLKPIKGESDMNLGDQISVLRNLGPLDLYYHHGIYVGGEKPIVGFGGLDWEGFTEVGFGTDIEKVTVDKYRHGDDDLFRVIWPPGVAKKPRNVVFIAEAFYKAYQKDPAVFGKYHVTKNNCEHFASYCKTGLMISKQVEDFHNDVLDFFNIGSDDEDCEHNLTSDVADKFVEKLKLPVTPRESKQ